MVIKRRERLQIYSLHLTSVQQCANVEFDSGGSRIRQTERGTNPKVGVGVLENLMKTKQNGFRVG